MYCNLIELKYNQFFSISHITNKKFFYFLFLIFNREKNIILLLIVNILDNIIINILYIIEPLLYN